MSREFDPTRDRANPPRPMPDRRPSRSTEEALDLALKSAPSKGKDTGEWVNTVSEIASTPSPVPSESPADAAEAAEGVGLGMVQMLERLFDALTHCASEYHRAVSASGDAINIERPVHVKAGDERYGSRGEAAFSGRLMLREWSLVLRGQPERIDGVIISSDQLFHYKANPDGFTPYFVIELKSAGDYARWMIGRKPVTVLQLPLFAKQLVAALVRVAKKGRVTSTFRFSTGKTAAMHAISPPPAAPESGTLEQTGTLPQRPRSYDEDADPVFAALTCSISGSLPIVSEAPAPQRPPHSEAGFQTPSPPVPDPQAQRSANMQTLTVSEALRIAYDGLTTELAAIQQAVSYSLESNDPVAAEALVQRSAKVKDLQERARLLCQEWLTIKPSG